MKSPKAYRVARRYQEQCLGDSDSKTNLSQTTRNYQMSSQTIHNIFRDNQEMRLRKLDLNKQQEYNILGINEFGVYNRIKQRRKKDLMSNGDDRTFGTFVSARTSRQAVPNDGYLTKEEVLRLCSPHLQDRSRNEPTLQQCLISSNSKGSQRDSRTSTYLISPSSNIPNLAGEIKQNEKFSLFKLKSKMVEYQKIWKKYPNRHERHEISAILLKRHNVLQHNQNQSYFLLKRHRLCKPKNFLKDSNTLDSIPWSQTLRTTREELLYKDQYIQRIEPNGLKNVGKSKLMKETQWVQQKYSEGFFFESKRQFN